MWNSNASLPHLASHALWTCAPRARSHLEEVLPFPRQTVSIAETRSVQESQGPSLQCPISFALSKARTGSTSMAASPTTVACRPAMPSPSPHGNSMTADRAGFPASATSSLPKAPASPMPTTKRQPSTRRQQPHCPLRHGNHGGPNGRRHGGARPVRCGKAKASRRSPWIPKAARRFGSPISTIRTSPSAASPRPNTGRT